MEFLAPLAELFPLARFVRRGAATPGLRYRSFGEPIARRNVAASAMQARSVAWQRWVQES